jgi:hypothetical protein
MIHKSHYNLRRKHGALKGKTAHAGLPLCWIMPEYFYASAYVMPCRYFS